MAGFRLRTAAAAARLNRGDGGRTTYFRFPGPRLGAAHQHQSDIRRVPPPTTRGFSGGTSLPGLVRWRQLNGGVASRQHIRPVDIHFVRSSCTTAATGACFSDVVALQKTFLRFVWHLRRATTKRR